MSTAALWADGGILDEIAVERRKQDEKWGEQNHPSIGGHAPLSARWDYVGEAARARSWCNHLAAEGVVGWDNILLEEVYEALAELDPAKIRDELIQVAAVAVAWIEALDRAAA